MNSHFKVRPKIEQPTISKLFKSSRAQGDCSRRMHTEAYEQLKDTQHPVRRINIYPSKPLAENKQITNVPSKSTRLSIQI